ncbi:hypothetical protein DCC81_08315 [Chitinophaga parva]|uniref:DUF3829 domain-containing protein n=1 Tax=Chitinophaga parva TaxID=2169414 RepID=A0A2T7BP35_9BACT|nr:hypothetical protein [Chitinophaga parva]PUZ29438.1 hypothetical protein DCC81_08315 [Chitinophaga parva]
MKNAFVLMACSVAMMATSCNNLTGTGKGTDSTAYASSSENDANAIIGYTNSVVDLLNHDMDYLDQMSRYVTQVDKALHNPGDRFAFLSISTPFSMPRIKAFNDKNDPAHPSSALAKEDQAFFKAHMAAYTEASGKLETFRKEEADYLKAEDYKDDKSVKGLALLDSIRNYAGIMIDEKTAVMKRINTVADAAEAVALKDSPLRQPIHDMKADMAAVKAFVSGMGQHADDYKTFADSAQTGYSSLEQAQTAHAAANSDNVKKADKDSQYKNFYDKYHDFLLRAKKIMRDAGDAGKLTDSQLEDLDNDYESMITAYNSFTS